MSEIGHAASATSAVSDATTDTGRHGRGLLPTLLRAAAVAAVCALLATMMILFTSAADDVAGIWLANAFLLGVAMRAQHGRGALLAAGGLGTFAANLLTGSALVQAVAFAAINLGEVLLAYAALRAAGLRPRIDPDERDFFLGVPIVMIAPAVAAAAGAAWWSAATGAAAWPSFVRWWASDVLGMIVLLPVLWTYSRAGLRSLFADARAREFWLWLCAAVLVAATALRWLEYPFVVISLPLLFAAYRVGVFRTTLLCMICALTLVGTAVSNAGALGADPADRHMLLGVGEVGLYSALCLLGPLLVSIVVQQREAFARQMGAALAERRVLADIVEGSDAAVQVADRELRWLAINPAAADAFAQIYGTRPRIGERIADHLAARPDDRAAIEAAWNRALAGERFVLTRSFDGGGQGRVWEMHFSPLHDGAGALVGAYQFAYDVTARLRDQSRLAETEDALRQSQKLETIGQLTGGVAHDFNNLLTPVVGALDYARMALVRDEEEKQIVASGLKAAYRARDLIQRLLAFSRRQRLRPQAVDVPSLVRDMVDILSRTLGPGIEIALDLEPRLPAAHVDPNQLELALINLAVNARDAMSGEGVVVIKARAADDIARAGDEDAQPAPRYIRIDVCDTGIGMDEATLKRAVEPFFTTKASGSGTGLGLSSVHGMAVQSGGGFRLESAPGQGTTAMLWIPVSTESPAETLVLPSLADAGSECSGTVLLVDDQPLVRGSTAQLLRRAGYGVVEAASGSEAIEALSAHAAIDVLVTDYAMPEMSGTRLADCARALRPQLPILLMTGYADLADGATDLPRLDKPFRPAQLFEAIDALLRNAGTPRAEAESAPSSG